MILFIFVILFIIHISFCFEFTVVIETCVDSTNYKFFFLGEQYNLTSFTEGYRYLYESKIGSDFKIVVTGKDEKDEDEGEEEENKPVLKLFKHKG